MKRRIFAVFVALMCAMTLLAAPAQAYAPSDGEDQAVTYSETVRWYFRTNHGVEEMRLWSITRQMWLTDWIPVPDP